MSYTFQSEVGKWADKCFGPEWRDDKTERDHRFFEEALEVMQSRGVSASVCHQLVDYVFSRAKGSLPQEVGGVLTTLAALCEVNNIDMESCGATELDRMWRKIEEIRAKQALKPKCSPLPQCPHDHLDMDGFCHACGEDCRGIH
jgi:hypothetical protein